MLERRFRDRLPTDAFCLIDRRSACRAARLHQVMGNFRLPIDGYDLAGQPMKIDALPPSVKVDLHPLMHQPLAVEACTDTGPVEEIDGPGLDEPGTNAAQHMFAGPVLDDYVLDAVIVQLLAQQQTRRAGADDRDLRAHQSRIPSLSRPTLRPRRGMLQRTRTR